MEKAFSHTTASTFWLVAVTAISLAVSLRVNGSPQWLLGIGLGLVLIAGWLGCKRTDRFYACEVSVSPNRLEGIVGWTGAAMIIAAFIGLVLRAVLK